MPDAHGCPACPHPGVGPAIAGSPDVNTNRRPAFRFDDPGIHMACCGTNQWKAMQGSVTVYINGKPAVRIGDKTRHCGGIGTVIEGSTNVIIGGPPGMGSSSGGG
ncbi:MAG TPA: PAAR domain-containing protein, partial [Kofleriaceae bacterium]